MPDKIVLETYRGMVMAQETDSNDHMNVQFYTTKYDMASGQFLAQLGYDLQGFKNKNLGFAYVELGIQYLKEVLEDDVIHIQTTVEKVANKVVTIKHQMKDSITDQLVSEAVAKWVIFDKRARKAIPLDEDLKKNLLDLMG